ncbi:MAG TPA: DUF2079 domain-containing protein [Polyangiaceae bacterium]|nr:DUF2079 domain-containing protein [Polyangiaceae bacterium]
MIPSSLPTPDASGPAPDTSAFTPEPSAPARDADVAAPLPLLTRLARTGALAGLECVSAGLAGWEISGHATLPQHTRSNGLWAEARGWIFLDMGVALVAGALVLGALFLRRRDLGVVERLVRRLSPLALAALVPLLFDVRLWSGWELVFLPLALVFGFGTWAAARAVLETPPAFPGLAGRGRTLRHHVAAARRRAASLLAGVDAPLLVAVMGACAYAVYFSAITIEAHRNLGTSSFDMGLEDNLMWNLVHGGPLFKSTPFGGPTGTHFSHHATFFSFVLAPLYALAPRPETLLAVQATLLGAAAVPLQLYARRHVPPWTATLVAVLYLAYAPLHGANLYDFHYLPLGVVFLWLVLYAVEARRHVLAVVAALLAMSVREDVAFLLAVLGVFLLLSGSSARAGALLAVTAGGYFLVMKMGVMPRYGGGGESFVNQYAGLVPPEAEGFRGVVETLAGNPVYTESVTLERDKLVYALQLLVPLLFLPLARPIGILLVVPGFLFTLLSTHYAPLTQISFQYTSYWTVFLFIGLVLALERAGRRGAGRRRALAAGVVASSLACSYAFGAVFQKETARGGFDRFHFGTTDADLARRASLAALVAEIPPGARVSASEHLVPHVSSREDAYTLRFGVFDAEYLLLELPLRGDEREPAATALRDEGFGVVDDRGELVLAKRGEPPVRNAAVLARVR